MHDGVQVARPVPAWIAAQGQRRPALTSAHAAQLFSLHLRKGTVAVGFDADLTPWDPGEQRVISAVALFSVA